ncbi:MAG: hypothetical protein RR614_00190 [Eubacterium sp.]
MAFKGKSVIELRNFETGEVEMRTEDENMVTNAAYNLVNFDILGIKDSVVDLANRRPKWMTPLLKSCFGGLLLFEKNITEDVNMILPPCDNDNVGRASGVYTGSDARRGTLNASESKEINAGKGYRFVWDFPTDRCNGTICCVCLTSYAGGSVGLNTNDLTANTAGIISSLGPDTNGSTNPLLSESYIAQNSTDLAKFPNKSENCSAMGCFNPNEFLYAINDYNSKQIIFIRVKYSRKVGLSSFFIQESSEKTVTTTVPLTHPRKFKSDENYIYSIRTHDTNQLDVVIFDGSSLEVIKEETFAVQDAKFLTYSNTSAQTEDAIYSDGYYYVAANIQGQVGYYKIKAEDPSDYQIITYTGSGAFCINKLGESLFLIPTNKDTTPHRGFKLNSKQFDQINLSRRLWTTSGSYYATSSIRFANSKYIKPPFMLRLESMGTTSSDTYLQVFTPFLSTINNLSSPVVKNETQTMKVTYEITEV